MTDVVRIGERYRLARLAAKDDNAAFETNEIDEADLAEGGDGIVYAGTKKEAAEIRAKMARGNAERLLTTIVSECEQHIGEIARLQTAFTPEDMSTLLDNLADDARAALKELGQETGCLIKFATVVQW